MIILGTACFVANFIFDICIKTFLSLNKYSAENKNRK